jgi:hypothetical protein
MEWLLEGEAWIEYRARVDLLGEGEDEAQVRSARQSMLADGKIGRLLTELEGWPGEVIASHRSASQPFHKLTFIADLGLRASDPAVEKILRRALAHQASEGPFQLPMNIPTHYGGSGEDRWAWALCDAPLIVYALVRMGLEETPEVQEAITYLTGLVRENGWPCVVSKELGKFRGPGRKGDPCPFATLAMLKMLGQCKKRRDSPESRVGAETLLELWRESTERHPYMFFMGTDFRKLKAPLVWYDVLHVLDVLSNFEWLRGDVRLLEMAEVMEGKGDEQGRFTPESIWTIYKDWEFGQKKAPSRWLTLLAWRILKRLEGND